MDLSPTDFLIVYLGSARLEKGYQLLPYVVGRTFEFAGQGKFQDISPDTIHFAFQSSPQIIGYHPDITKALERMDEMPRSQVTLLRDSLGDREYAMLLHASDAVILPYEADKYRVRGSGIVSEALTAGKIILATRNSYPAKRIAKNAGADAETPLEFATGLLTVIQNRKLYLENAQIASTEYRKHNALEAYWPKCMQVETRVN